MNKSLATIGVGIASLLICQGAIAESTSIENGWYIQASVGRAQLNDMAGVDHQVVLSNGSEITKGRNAEFGLGAVYDLAVGRQLATGLRADIEYSHRANVIDRLINTGIQPNTVVAQSDSKVRSHSLLANVYYDFSNSSPITPYLGLGVGMAKVSTQWTAVSGANEYRFEDSDFTYAAQLTAGAKWAVTPNWGLFAQYRYFVAPNVQTSSSATRALTRETLTFKDDYISQSFSLGIRYAF